MGTMQLHTGHPSLGAPLHRVLTSLRPVLQRALDRGVGRSRRCLRPRRACCRSCACTRASRRDRLPSSFAEGAEFTATLVAQLVALEILTWHGARDDANEGLRLTPRGRLRAVAWRDKAGEVLNHTLETLSAPERAAIAVALPALEHLVDALGAARPGG